MGGAVSKKKLKGQYLEELHKKVPDLDVEEIMQVYQDFMRQTRGKSKLTKKDFTQVYGDAFGSKAAPLAENIFNAFDVNGDGKVDFEEFLVGLSVTETKTGTGKESRVKKLRWAFNVYDKDKSGTIDRNEMRMIVKAVFDLGSAAEMMQSRTPSDFADELFDEVDFNGDGEITFQEFVAAADKNETMINLLLPAPPEENTHF